MKPRQPRRDPTGAALEVRLGWPAVLAEGCRWIIGEPGRGPWKWCGAPCTGAGGTGSAADPFQMSSLRGAVLNGNTVITASVGPVTIFVPAGTYQLSVNNPSTPGTTGTIAFPDLEIGSSFNHETSVVGTGGTPSIQQTVGGNDVITTGFQSDGFSPQAVTLTLQNLEITGGSFSGIFTGVENDSGRSVTTITNCNVHDNSDPFGPGGAIFNQTGDLTITGSTFANNTASNQGGAIFYDLPNSNGSPGTFGKRPAFQSAFARSMRRVPSGTTVRSNIPRL